MATHFSGRDRAATAGSEQGPARSTIRSGTTLAPVSVVRAFLKSEQGPARSAIRSRTTLAPVSVVRAFLKSGPPHNTDERINIQRLIKRQPNRDHKGQAIYRPDTPPRSRFANNMSIEFWKFLARNPVLLMHCRSRGLYRVTPNKTSLYVKPKHVPAPPSRVFQSRAMWVA
jgi:hypothetical protein